MAIQSCFSLPLKTGTTLIAYLSMLGTLLHFIYWVYFIINYGIHAYSPILIPLPWIILQFVLSVMLFIGAEGGKIHFIFPYLSWNFTLIFIVITRCVYSFFHALADGSEALTIILYLISFPISIGLSIYLWLVVFSFFQKSLSEQVGHEINLFGGKNSRGPSNNNVVP